MTDFKNVLYFIIFILDLCPFSISIDHHKTFNELQIPAVMIVNKVHDNLLDETMVHYGSIVHRKYVLTFADVLKKLQPQDILVYIDCYSDWFIFLRSCSSQKQVSHFEFVRDEIDFTEIKTYYGFIVLKSPIRFNPRIQLIPLAVVDDIIDHSNCFIYSYIHHDNSNSFASYITPIKVQNVNGSYILPKLRKRFHFVDNNEITLKQREIVSEVSFSGSPIVCPRQNSTIYVQVGISNIKIVFYPWSDILSKANSQISEVSYHFSLQERMQIMSIVSPRSLATYSIIGIIS